MKTNFDEWSRAYYLILLPYYNKFTSLFPHKEPPTMKDFMFYCFINTSKVFNHSKNTYEAYISPY